MNPRRWLAALGLTALAGLASPTVAQEPPDSTQLPDSLGVPGPEGPADSLAMSDSTRADSVYYNLPRVHPHGPTGFATGVWEWDRHAIMANGANTVAELLQEIPGIVTLLGGDYGTPASVSAFGTGGAGYRVLIDGFELYPVDGGVVDLQRVGLAGIGTVRFDRSMGQMVIEMWTHEYDDGRPFSVIEAGTGDLDTNMFRGVYADPTALGGSLAVGLERMDTRGRRRLDGQEGGNRTGSWVRYQFHRRDRFGLGFDLRRGSAQTKVVDYVPSASRTDMVVRASLRARDGLVLGAYGGRSTLQVDDPGTSPTDPIDVTGGTRRQAGATLDLEGGGMWFSGAYRYFGGALPSGRLEGSAGYASDRWGGVSGRLTRSTWDGTALDSRAARAWLRPVDGATLFAAWEAGRFGSRTGPLLENPVPPLALAVAETGDAAITDRETARLGAVLSAGRATLAGAVLYASSDLALPLGISLDLGAAPATGVHRRGVETAFVLPTFWAAFTLEGSYQWWDEAGPYLPRQLYQGAFEYHKVFKETGNLEVWASLGVRGHDPMLTFVDPDGVGAGAGGLTEVPFYQSWYARVQVRVVTVRLWIGMDNFTLRRNLQNYPDRTFPYARSFFALRWDLWN